MKVISIAILGLSIFVSASARHWRPPQHYRPRPSNHQPVGTVLSNDIDCSIPNNQVILHPHPTSCILYLQCNHGVTIERPCAPGTKFSASYGVCVHPYQSECTADEEDEEPSEEIEDKEPEYPDSPPNPDVPDDSESAEPDLPEEPLPEEPEDSDVPDKSDEEPLPDKPEEPNDKPEPTTDQPEPSTDKPEPSKDKPEPTTDQPEPPTDTPEPPTDQPELPSDKPESSTDTPEPPTDTADPPTDTADPPTDTPEPPTDQTEPTTTDPSEESVNALSICAAEPSRIFLAADPQECSNYVICTTGEALVRSCDSGEYFDLHAAKCLAGSCQN